MSKGPQLFANFGKEARNLLFKDYSDDQKFSISSLTESGLGLTSNLVQKGGLSSGAVEAQYKHQNATIDVKLDPEFNQSLSTLTVTNFPSSAKYIASVKLPEYSSSKLEVQYFNEHATFTSAVGLKQSPAVDFSATVGTPSIAFGAEASYMTSSREFSKYNAGVTLTKPDSNASVILADKGDALRFSYLHHLRQLNGGSVVGEMSRKFSSNDNTLTVGCSYVVDRYTLVKAKLNNHGNLGALLQHEIKPKSLLTISSAFDTKALEKRPKFGFALSLKP